MQNERELGAKQHSMSNGCELNCTVGLTLYEEVDKGVLKVPKSGKRGERRKYSVSWEATCITGYKLKYE